MEICVAVDGVAFVGVDGVGHALPVGQKVPTRWDQVNPEIDAWNPRTVAGDGCGAMHMDVIDELIGIVGNHESSGLGFLASIGQLLHVDRTPGPDLARLGFQQQFAFGPVLRLGAPHTPAVNELGEFEGDTFDTMLTWKSPAPSV